MTIRLSITNYVIFRMAKKKDPREGNLYGLCPTDEDNIYRLCGGEEETAKTAKMLFNSQRASNTGKNYSCVIKDFQDFCHKKDGYSYEQLL